MSQEQILRYLKKWKKMDKNRWFTSTEMIKRLKRSSCSITTCLKSLRNSKFIKVKQILNKKDKIAYLYQTK